MNMKISTEKVIALKNNTPKKEEDTRGKMKFKYKE